MNNYFKFVFQGRLSHANEHRKDGSGTVIEVHRRSAVVAVSLMQALG